MTQPGCLPTLHRRCLERQRVGADERERIALGGGAPRVEFVGEVLRVDLQLVVELPVATSPAIADRRLVDLVRGVLERFASISHAHRAGGEYGTRGLIGERQ